MFNPPLNTFGLNKNDVVLLVHYGDNWLRGSEHCLLDLTRALKACGLTPVVWCNAPALQHALNQQGILCECSPMAIFCGYTAPKYDLGRWWQQMRKGIQLIKHYKPRIVHSNSAAPCQWMSLACALTQTAQVTQLHAHYGVLKDRLSLGLHFCSTIIGVSYAATRALMNDGVKNTLHIVPNSIDATQLLQQPRLPLKTLLGIAPQDILLLSVGSLIKRKGHAFLLQVVAHLNQNNHRVYAAIIGAGEESTALKNLSKQLNLEDRVFFLGESQQAFGYMQGDADALVSTAEDEVFGLVLAEANLAKLPVIAPNIIGINSVIKHQKTGYLYTPNHLHALAKAILSLPNKDLWQPKIHKGYWRAITVFAPQKNMQALLQKYQLAIDHNQNNSVKKLLASMFFIAALVAKHKYTQIFSASQKLRGTL